VIGEKTILLKSWKSSDEADEFDCITLEIEIKAFKELKTRLK